jgi:biotin carboxyl carrier protein
MLFNAKVNQHNYQVSVTEERDDWTVCIRAFDSDEWREISIPKEHFQTASDGLVSLLYKNSSYLVDLVPEDSDYNVYTRGSYRTVTIIDDEKQLRDELMGGGTLGGQQNLKSGMPGKIVTVFVEPGDSVKEGDPLLIMEAMKMENEMLAKADAIIDQVFVKEGQNVKSGATLVSFRKPD